LRTTASLTAQNPGDFRSTGNVIMPPMNPRRPRVAVIAPYWDFWEHTLGSGFRQSRVEQLHQVAASVIDHTDVVVAAQVASVDAAMSLVNVIRDGSVDAVLFLCSMGAPPNASMALLDALPRIPVVVWAIHDMDESVGLVDHRAITANGATVGAPMLTNVLGRRGRPFDVVLGRLQDPRCIARVRSAVTAAAAAGFIRHTRVGRVGAPLDGYEQVDVDADALRGAIGVEVVSIPSAAFTQAFRDAAPQEVAAISEEVAAAWEVTAGTDGGVGLERSLRCAAAIQQLVTEYRLDAGALNCHVPDIRFNDDIGVTPCFALGRMTSMGVPWTCTGDVVTAVAMLAVKRLGGAALYHELETVDYSTGELIIANSGEHDLAWADPERRPRLAPNGWYCGKDPLCGVCAIIEPTAGPATLVGFTPHAAAAGGFRFVAASGQFTDRRFPECGTANGAFRFDVAPVEEAWERWARGGVNHHSCATPGRFSGAIEAMAMHLGVESILV
jgi:L-arabinose isomerase